MLTTADEVVFAAIGGAAPIAQLRGVPALLDDDPL
jgi:hypothetical protein